LSRRSLNFKAKGRWEPAALEMAALEMALEMAGLEKEKRLGSREDLPVSSAQPCG
jgi:hypothetical protein